MNRLEFTRGPWVAILAPNGHTYIRSPNSANDLIATVSGTNALARGSLEGNAALLAHAPIMRATLKDILTFGMVPPTSQAHSRVTRCLVAIDHLDVA